MKKYRMTSLFIILAISIIAMGFAAKSAFANSPDAVSKYELKTINISSASALNASPSAEPGTNNGIPIGAVMDWWQPTDNTPLPPGFMYCDGSQITDPYSPIQDYTLPDINDRFVRGITNPGSLPDEGYTTGGNNSHTHHFDLAQHLHDLAPHVHDTITIESFGGNGGGYQPFGGAFPKALNTTSHTHSFTYLFLPFPGFTENTDVNFDTLSGNRRPPYVGLLKLCWVGKSYDIYLPLTVK